jgi:tRNA threonylcarbamoyladenosine biosynthesis protein TsaE
MKPVLNISGENKTHEVITESPAETKQLAGRLAGKLGAGSVLALHGELGSGKTCFVQGLAEALSVAEVVNSPTFTIINEYRGRCRLYHVDLYRINSVAELETLGLEDYLGGDGITAIEWPEKISSLLPENTIHVYFEFMDINRRRIRADF